MKTLVLLGIISLLAHAKEYRFDYEFNEEAGGWLKFHAVPAVWDDARRRCHAEGAVLASPLTDKLKAAIVAFVKEKTTFPRTIFTGVHSTFSKGDYSSVEGVPLLRLSITWAAGEPDNFDNEEGCLVMMTNAEGNMADIRCAEVRPYVCYKKDTPLTITDCGPDPGYTLEPRTGSCYKVHETGLIWTEAYMTCVAEGGYLAVINNNAEAEVIKKIFEKHSDGKIFSKYRGSMFVGYHDWHQYGRSFMTIHGETLEATYSRWAGGEPNNVTEERVGDQGQYCGSILRSGELDDGSCSVYGAFICEKDPNSLRLNPVI